MQHVPARGGHARLATRVACERHLELRKDRQPRDGILDFEKACIKIDLPREINELTFHPPSRPALCTLPL
jgi:hypothetical protein